jgi:cell wall-associated NlpC family hydrolase
MKHRFARLAIPGVCIALLGGLFGVAAPASASIDSKLAEAQKLQHEIDANGEKISMLAEQFDAAKLKLDQANGDVTRNQTQLTAAQAETSRVQGIVSARAAAIYMNSGAQTPLDAINVANVHEAGVRAQYASTTADRDAHLLAQLSAAKSDLRSSQHKLADAQKQARDEFDAISASRRDLEKANAAQQKLLDGVKGEIKTLLDQQAQRQAAADKAASDAHMQSVSNGGGGGHGDPGGVSMPNAPAPSGGAAAAVAYAQAQLGKPYQYAGTGPGAYDCSGLTMMAWAAGGVSMPHSSYAQATMFPRVADSALQPGDIIIYYADHHHVGLYVGGGMTISATHTGDFVRLQPVFREGFQYGVRPG